MTSEHEGDYHLLPRHLSPRPGALSRGAPSELARAVVSIGRVARAFVGLQRLTFIEEVRRRSIYSWLAQNAHL